MNVDREHPLRAAFEKALRASFAETGLTDPEIEGYVANLLVHFAHTDAIYRLRDAQGRRVESIVGMLEEGDVRLNATSFAREREVHKHLGDFLLFASGLFPELLKHELVDARAQGAESYRIAASFDHWPYEAEAPILSRLATEFEGYQFALRRVRDLGLAA